MQLHIQIIFASFVLLLLIFLLSKKDKLIHNNVFALFIGALLLNSCFEILTILHILTDRTNFNQFIGYLYGPLLLGYVSTITRISKKIVRIDYWHFVPAFMILIIELIHYATGLFEPFPLWKFIAVLAVIHNMGYLFWIFKKVSRAKAEKSFHHLTSWLNLLIMGYAMLLGMFVLELFFALVNQFDYVFVVRYGSLVLLLIYINGMVYLGLSTPEIFHKKVKYYYSKLDAGQKIKMAEKLKLHMRKHEPFLSPDLSLDILAAELKVGSPQLSQVINESYHKNIKDFINSYRIEKAKHLLVNCPELIIKEVMYDSGFQSKSTFNFVFEKTTGMSPSRFRHMHKKLNI